MTSANKTSVSEAVPSIPDQPLPAQLHFGNPQTPLPVSKVTASFTTPTQSTTPLVTRKVTSDISSNCLFGGQATLTQFKPQQVIKPTSVESSVSPSANSKSVQIPTTSSIFDSQHSSFASLCKSASVTTITTTVSTSITKSGVSIFANLQSVIDKATESSTATTTNIEPPKSTLSFGSSSGHITQPLFESVSSTSTTKPVFGRTTFSSTGGLFESISKPVEAFSSTSNTPSTFGSSNTSAATTPSINKPETLVAASDTINLLENAKPWETATESSSVSTSPAMTNKSSSVITLPISVSDTYRKSNESPTTATQISLFVSKSTSSANSTPISLNVLATTTTSATPSIFSSSVTTTIPNLGVNIFGASAAISATTSSGTTPSIFGSPKTTAVTAFGTPTTSSYIFGSSGSIFGSIAASPTSNNFSTPTTTTVNVFGTPTSTSPTNIFCGVTPASTAPNVFGSTTNNASVLFGSQGASIIGTPEITESLFGQQGALGNQATTPSSIFGQPATFGSGLSDFGSSTTSTSGNIFGNAAPLNCGFGTGFGALPNTFGSQATTQAPSTGLHGFGNLSVGGTSSSPGSVFGNNSSSGSGASQVTNPFGKVENKPLGNSPSGTTTTKIFVSPTTTASPVFGSGGGTTFGTSNTGQKPAFGQTSTFGSNTFGSPQPGSFSGGGASPIVQSGFGAPAAFPKPSGFGSPPVFGDSPTAAFGAAPSFAGAPAFGGSPTFDNPEKVFGASQSASGGFGAAAIQQAADFGNLASQNTIGFGSLAQQASTPTSSPFSSEITSFSSWR